MPSLETLAALCSAVSLSFLFILAMRYAAGRLSKDYGSDVRVVWYLFSLAVTGTLLVAWWAKHAGAIDASGEFHGRAGVVLQIVLKGALNIEASVKIYGALVALFVVPQLASWLLSGLSGCASAPVMVGTALRFFFWSILKSLVVAAGVIAAVVSFGWAYGWGELSTVKVTTHITRWLGLLALAFGLLYVYRDLYEAKPASESTPAQRKVGRVIARVTAWMNRNIRSFSDT